MTNEDRRTLTIEAILADTRDKRIEWAERALDMVAFPSPNLCTLALLSGERTPNSWEVDDLFRRSLKELDLSIQDREVGLRQYARDVAENIISGVIEPLEGARQLCDLTCALDYPENMQPWGGFDEDLFIVRNVGEELCFYFSDDMIPEIKIEAHALLRKIPKRYF